MKRNVRQIFVVTDTISNRAYVAYVNQDEAEERARILTQLVTIPGLKFGVHEITLHGKVEDDKKG